MVCPVNLCKPQESGGHPSSIGTSRQYPQEVRMGGGCNTGGKPESIRPSSLYCVLGGQGTISVFALKAPFRLQQQTPALQRAIRLIHFRMAAVPRQGGGIYVRVLENAVPHLGGVPPRLGTSKEDGLRRWTNSTK